MADIFRLKETCGSISDSEGKPFFESCLYSSCFGGKDTCRKVGCLHRAVSKEFVTDINRWQDRDKLRELKNDWWFWCLVCMRAKSLQLRLTLCDPMECTFPGSSVHGILQARMLECVCMSSSKRSSRPRDQTRVSYVSCIGRWVLYC